MGSTFPVHCWGGFHFFQYTAGVGSTFPVHCWGGFHFFQYTAGVGSTFPVHCWGGFHFFQHIAVIGFHFPSKLLHGVGSTFISPPVVPMAEDTTTTRTQWSEDVTALSPWTSTSQAVRPLPRHSYTEYYSCRRR